MYVRLNTNGRMQRKFGIFLTPSPKILDVFVRFFGRKNVRLGVNGNSAYDRSSDPYCLRRNVSISKLKASLLATKTLRIVEIFIRIMMNYYMNLNIAQIHHYLNV